MTQNRFRVTPMETNRYGSARTLDSEVSATVRREMADRLINQTTMSAAVGMHPNVFGRKYRGESRFSPAELSAVANELGTTAAALTAESEARLHQQVAA